MRSTPFSMAAAISAIPKRRPQTQIRQNPRSQTCPHQQRTFRSSASTNAAMTKIGLPSGVSRSLPAQQGMKAQMKKMTRRQLSQGDDFGLMPKTFIRPANSQLPSLFSSQWRRRLKIELLHMQLRLGGLFSLKQYLHWGAKKDPITKKKLKQPLLLRERLLVARDLHKRFYKALAAGDLNTINDMVCLGLRNQSRMQIDHRKAIGAPKMRFEILKYRGITYPQWLRWPLLTLLPFHSTRVVADRLNPLPMTDSWIRQTVVRLKTEQSLDRGDEKGTRVVDLTEYVVLQKSKINGDEGPWKLWGTVQPSTVEEIDKMLDGETDSVGLKDRLATLGQTAMGG